MKVPRTSPAARSTVACLAAALGALLAHAAIAGTDPISIQGDVDIESNAPKEAPKQSDDAEAAKKAEKKVNFVFVPIPISNPTIGSGLAVAGMALYKVDADSPDSFTGMGGGYTSNHSWAAGLVEKLYLDADRYRISAGGAYANVNYSFFGVGDQQANAGVSIPINQKVMGAGFDARIRVWNAIYVGVRYRYVDVTTTVPLVLPPNLPFALPPDLDVATQSVGLVANYDTRDRQFSPHRGLYIDFASSFARKQTGQGESYQTYSLAFNHYQELGSKGVLAERITLCDASDSTPFFDLCMFGSNSDLRGYDAGRYRDHFMTTGQVEYRRSLTTRFGAVAFAGAGAVAADLQSLGSSTLLPSAGLGLRYLAAPVQGVTVSADYAWGKGSQGLYIYVGDAF
jgi:outer membrane protein assembly factor BamA